MSFRLRRRSSVTISKRSSASQKDLEQFQAALLEEVS
jgi:hypothetical protein